MKDSGYADMEESEKIVAHFLRELNIWWIYESPVFVYDEKERPRVWTPDFYLPKLGMYVEVCGSENPKPMNTGNKSTRRTKFMSSLFISTRKRRSGKTIWSREYLRLRK